MARMTETIHVIETEFTTDGPVNVTRDGRRIPVLDIIAMEAVIIEAHGRTAWLRYGREHREDGPAVIYDDGHTEWYRDGNLHREGGPAVYGSGRAEEWWIDGEPHRDFGPAIINADGTEEWFIRGREFLGAPQWIAENGLPHCSEWEDLDRVQFKLRFG
jgi:hypothetical protein